MITEFPEYREPMVLRELMVTLENLVIQVMKEKKEHKVPKETLAHQDRMEQREIKVR